MSAFSKAFSLFRAAPLDPEDARRMQIDREWHSLRTNAMSDSERAEIDAIFSRII